MSLTASAPRLVSARPWSPALDWRWMSPLASATISDRPVSVWSTRHRLPWASPRSCPRGISIAHQSSRRRRLGRSRRVAEREARPGPPPPRWRSAANKQAIAEIVSPLGTISAPDTTMPVAERRQAGVRTVTEIERSAARPGWLVSSAWLRRDRARAGRRRRRSPGARPARTARCRRAGRSRASHDERARRAPDSP